MRQMLSSSCWPTVWQRRSVLAMTSMLHSPLSFRNGSVSPNRIALAPMTNQQSHADGTLGDDEFVWLARRADGGFGMIETCAAYVQLDGKAWPGELGVDRDEDLPGLTRLAARIKQAGGLAVAQIFHGGVRAASAQSGVQPWSASVWHEDGPKFETPRAATIADIEGVIARFADAGHRCQRAGFDGIELHGAHGYLLSQFMSRTMNPRTDGWGGDAIGRARLIREVMRAVRAKVGTQFLVGARLSLEDFGSAKGLDLDDSLQVAAWLAEDSADFIHASLWDFEKMTHKRPDQHPLPLLRAALPKDVRILAAGKIWTTADADKVMALGADMVALGQSAIINPDWPKLSLTPGWQPQRAPAKSADLLARGVSQPFIEYLRRFKTLIAD